KEAVARGADAREVRIDAGKGHGAGVEAHREGDARRGAESRVRARGATARSAGRAEGGDVRRRRAGRDRSRGGFSVDRWSPPLRFFSSASATSVALRPPRASFAPRPTGRASPDACAPTPPVSATGTWDC